MKDFGTIPDTAKGAITTGDQSPSREEFLARFKAELFRLVNCDWESVSRYADDIGPTYWDDPEQRAEGPEECAEADASEWGEE